MRLFTRKVPVLPEPTGRVIDYRRCRWGHNIEIWPVQDSPGHYSGFCWARPGPKAGDDLWWATEYGYAVARVLSAKAMRDPDDMHKIEVQVVDRVAQT
jgi:hypothetical protein